MQTRIIYLAFLVIVIFVILSQAGENVYGKIMIVPDTMKVTVSKGSSVTMSSLVHTDSGNIPITANATDLVEQNGKGVIPSSSSQVVLQSQVLKKTAFDKLQYTLAVPSNQEPGTYNGNIMILDANGTTVPISLQVTVATTPDYYVIFGWLALGAVVSTIWTGLNDWVQSNTATPSTLPSKPSEQGQDNYEFTVIAGNGLQLPEKIISQKDYASAETQANHWGAKFSSILPTSSAANTPIDEIVSFAKENKLPSTTRILKVIFRSSVTAIGSIMAVAFVFNQFLQSNPAIADAPMGGWYIALGSGFLAHHALDNLIDEGTATLKSKFSGNN